MRIKIINFLTHLILLLFILGCKNKKTTLNQNKSDNTHIAIGTWNSCDKNGRYLEHKITDKYVIMMISGFDGIFVYKNKIVDNKLVLSEFLNNENLVTTKDTLITIFESEEKIILKSRYFGNEMDLKKSDFTILPIDTLNLKTWKHNVIRGFKERAEIKNCKNIE